MRRVVAIAAVALVALVGATPARAATAPASTVDWKPCKAAPQVDCATITVPLDWAEPEGKKIKVAIARQKATDPKRRIGSLLYNPGGPGGLGAQDIQLGVADQYTKKIRARFDIVSFDPRGLGASSPVKCPDPVPRGAAQKAALYGGKGLTERKFQDLRTANRKKGKACGPTARFMDAGSVVQDMDAIRAAVGDEKLTFHGVSYGTLLGQEYARRYPNRVRALLLDGVVDHTLSARKLLVSSAKANQLAFDGFVAWCDRAPKKCAVPNARKAFRTLYRRAEQGTLRDPVTQKRVSTVELLENSQTFLVYPELDKLAEYYAELLQPSAATFRVTSTTEAEKSSSYAGILCLDFDLQLRNAAELRALHRSMAKVAPDMKYSNLALDFVLSCQNWPNPVRNPQRPMVWKNVPPVVMISSRIDSATPFTWAQSAARQTGARLVTHDWGHAVIGRPENDACPKQTSTRYLVDLKLPAKNTHCRIKLP